MFVHFLYPTWSIIYKKSKTCWIPMIFSSQIFNCSAFKDLILPCISVIFHVFWPLRFRNFQEIKLKTKLSSNFYQVQGFLSQRSKYETGDTFLSRQCALCSGQPNYNYFHLVCKNGTPKKKSNNLLQCFSDSQCKYQTGLEHFPNGGGNKGIVYLTLLTWWSMHMSQVTWDIYFLLILCLYNT